MEKVEIVEFVIDEDGGVLAVALVDQPAIERTWQAFSQHKEYKFQVQDAARRIVSGPLMVADLPIYRRTPQGREFYGVFRAGTIEQIAMKFMQEGRTKDVNEMHIDSDRPEGVFMFESFLIDSTRGIMTPKGFDELPDGSWFASYKVDNDEVWQKVLDGTFRGFSVEGDFYLTNERVASRDWVDSLIEVLR